MTKITKMLSLAALVLAVAAPSMAKADTFITFVSSNGHRPRYEENRHHRQNVRHHYVQRREQNRHSYHHQQNWHRPVQHVYVAPAPTYRLARTASVWTPSPATRAQYERSYITYR